MIAPFDEDTCMVPDLDDDETLPSGRDGEPSQDDAARRLCDGVLRFASKLFAVGIVVHAILFIVRR